MNKRPLAPRFLNKLDNFLLINRPDTWSTRFHLVLYYSLLFMIALAAICFVIPTDHREKSFFGLWSGSAGVLALIGFIVWLVYLFRFNVFKQFGTVFIGDRIKTFVLYFFIVVMMIVVVYIPPVVESIRADYAYSSDQMATDINRINELITKLEHDRIPDEWNADTLILIDRKYYQRTEPYNEDVQYVDSSEYRWKTEVADSVKKLSGSITVIYKFFDLRFVEERRIEDDANVPVKSNSELYYSAYKNPSVNPSEARKELQKLLDKYEASQWLNEYYQNNDYSDLGVSIREKYDLLEVNSGFDHIADRKYRLDNLRYEDYIRSTYYFALVLTLLVFAFRHSTVKTFFLSLLVGVVLSILSGLFVAILGLRETGILYLMVFYFMVFIILSMLAFAAKKRSVITGIAINAFVLMTPFIPMICVALYYSQHRYEMYYDGIYNTEYYINKKLHFLISEFTGGIILLILIETLFKRLYRSWYSSPED